MLKILNLSGLWSQSVGKEGGMGWGGMEWDGMGWDRVDGWNKIGGMGWDGWNGME